MKFCVKCGANLEQEQNICKQCGYDLSSRQNKVDEEDIISTQSINNTELENKNKIIVDLKPLRKKIVLSIGAKVSVIGISIISVLLVVFFIVGNSLANPSKVVSKFQLAVASDNKAELINILYCDDNRLVINEKSISPLLSYFKDNPSYLNTVIKDLNKDVFNLDKINKLSEVNAEDSSNVVSIVYTGKKYLFFPSYKIGIKPAFIQVKTSIKDVVFSLNGTEIGKSDKDNYSKEFGPYIPGRYEVLGSYKGTYVNLSEPHTIDFITDNKGKANVEILTKLNYIKVKSEYPEALLFVNGKETGIKVMDAENFGPLNIDTKVYATITKEGKLLKSNEYTVGNGDNIINLSFQNAKNEIENMKNDIHDLVYWYTRYFTQAVNMNSFSSVEEYIYPGSKLYNEQKTYIPDTYNKGIKENIMSFNISSIKFNEDNESGVVTTEEIYNIENMDKSSVKTFKYKYTFKYNEAKKRYQLESIADNS